jgi:FkbH-like protein
MTVTETEIRTGSHPHRQRMQLMDALRIVNKRPQTTSRTLNVFFVCGFTPLHLKTFLSAYLQVLCPDRSIQLHTGLYGDVVGNLERAADAEADAVAVALEWPDFDGRLGVRAAVSTQPHIDDVRHSIENQSHRIQRVIEERLAGKKVALALPSLPIRLVSTRPKWLLNGLDAVLLKCVADFAMWASEKPHVRLLNPAQLDELSPSDARWDVRSELAAGFPYQLNHASILADLFSRMIITRVPKKGLITDLDDTLWNGIVGEVGIDAISWSLDRQTHVHALYQQRLGALAKMGAFLGVASKNDPAIVQQAFGRSDLLLDVTQVFPVEVSWGPKSAAVQRILQTWNVGPESVVFVDDSPIEVAEVQSAFPEIECLLFPKNDPKACVDFLDYIQDIFGKEVISEEDALRISSIRTQPAPSADFLQTAEAEISISWKKDPMDARPLDLINKTNQFNLNGKRYTESEWANYLRDPKSQLLLVSYEDKYGRLGKIAVIGARVDGGKISVETWVMSCRAFSRRIEHQCLRQLFNKSGVDEIMFQFEATPRNGPLHEFFTCLMGTAPEGPFNLSRRHFEQECPQLFHVVRKTEDE